MSITINHLVRSRRKTIALIIRPDGSLEIRAPLRMSENRIHEFVESHSDWVYKNQVRVQKHPPSPPKQFVDGEMFPFLGKSYPMHIVPHQRTCLTFDGKSFSLAKSQLQGAKEVFIRWYKAQAMLVLSQRILALSDKYGFNCQKIRISSARTRWGSCSTKGTLSFTWRLVMAPPEIIEYVVVHELVHTKIHNHSKSFWRGVAGILPGYKQYVVWLRRNGKFISLE